MEGEEEPVANGEVSSEDGSDKGTRKTDIIIITGKPEKCEAARKALLVSLLVCWLTVSVDHISRVDLYAQKRLSLPCLSVPHCPLWEIRVTPGKVHQLQEQCYSFLPESAVFFCVQTAVWLPVFGLFNVHTDVQTV